MSENTNSIPAVFGVNRYLWQKLQDTKILDPANYNGLTPIIPTQEEPTFIQAMEKQDGIGAFPYIVYAWSTAGYGTNYWACSDQITYLIASHDQKKLRELTLAIAGLLKRFDASASQINKFIATAVTGTKDAQGNDILMFPVADSVAGTNASVYRKYDYKYTSVQAINASISKTEDTQPYRASITIRVGYTFDDDGIPFEDLYQN